MPKIIAQDPRTRYPSGPSADDIGAAVKAKVTIPILGQKLFQGWKPGVSCLSPFRDERHTSFSVYGNGGNGKTTQAGEGGDVFDFYQLATGCTVKEAFFALKEMAGGQAFDVTPIVRKDCPKEKKEQLHPELSVPTADDLESISDLRSISVIGLNIAVDRGFLWAATLNGQRAFVVTDRTRKNYRTRRSGWGKSGKA